MNSAWIPPTLDKIFVTLGSTLRSLHIAGRRDGFFPMAAKCQDFFLMEPGTNCFWMCCVCADEFFSGSL